MSDARFFEIQQTLDTLYDFHGEYFDSLSDAEAQALLDYFGVGAVEVNDIMAWRNAHRHQEGEAERVATNVLRVAGITLLNE